MNNSVNLCTQNCQRPRKAFHLQRQFFQPSTDTSSKSVRRVRNCTRFSLKHFSLDRYGKAFEFELRLRCLHKVPAVIAAVESESKISFAFERSPPNSVRRLMKMLRDRKFFPDTCTASQLSLFPSTDCERDCKCRIYRTSRFRCRRRVSYTSRQARTLAMRSIPRL